MKGVKNSGKMDVSLLPFGEGFFLFDFLRVLFFIKKLYLKSLFEFYRFLFRRRPRRLQWLDRFPVFLVYFVEKFGSFSGFQIVIGGQARMGFFYFGFLWLGKVAYLSERTGQLLNVLQNLKDLLCYWSFTKTDSEVY